MPPIEHDDQIQPTDEYHKLLDELTTSNISHAEAEHLNMWLLDRSHEYREQQLTHYVLKPIEPLAQQTKSCAKLGKAACTIENQFEWTRQLSALDLVLSEAFESVQNASAGSSPLPNEWAEFRHRVATDSLLLTKVANKALERLRGREAKKGRRSKNWRNHWFVELVGRLSELQSCTADECVRLGTALWNIYVPGELINDPETAQKILQRH